jgi:uridine kinase
MSAFSGDAERTAMTPFVLGIVGDSGSGKSTLAESVTELLGRDRVTEVLLDDYHRYTREERAARQVTALHPSVHNIPLIQEHLQMLRQGRPLRSRTYEHANGTFGAVRTIHPNDFVLVRGLLGYPDDALRALYHLAVFLNPEPELLIRWKLRRDVRSRGYSEAEVLKYIAHHLLDSKEFVLPQAERADLVVRHELPDFEAPDTEIQTTLLLRRMIADLARREDLFGSLPGIRFEDQGELVRVELGEVDPSQVDEWARDHFPETFLPERIGLYTNEAGERVRRTQLVIVEVLVARSAELLRMDLPADPSS